MAPPVIRFILALCLAGHAQAQDLKDGDIIFQRSQSRQAMAIAAATHSNYTHMGLVFFDGDKPFVYEAIQPVTKTPLASWIARGENGSYVVKRLKDTSALDAAKLRQQVIPMIGKEYASAFEWSDKRIYCSELVWKAYERSSGLQLGALRTLDEFDLEHAIVKRIMKERYGADIPLKMQVIAPSDIFESPLLVTLK